MNPTPDPPDVGSTDTERRLAGRIEAMRGVLGSLLQDVIRAERRLDNNQAAQLLEANERLVVTALSAQTDADTATQALDDASHSAGHDALTELPNRALLLNRFSHVLTNVRRPGSQVALLFLDINNFKQINDTFGHAAGDDALKFVAQCLVSSVRETDTVSRHGGDEFLILLPAVSDAAVAAHVAEKVMAKLDAAGRIGGHDIRLTVSIGISVSPQDGADAQTLIERADAAMYLAKKQQRGGFVFHGNPPSILQGPPPVSPRPALRPGKTGPACAEQERRNLLLREANEHLVLAVLDAQDMLAAADQMRNT